MTWRSGRVEDWKMNNLRMMGVLLSWWMFSGWLLRMFLQSWDFELC